MEGGDRGQHAPDQGAGAPSGHAPDHAGAGGGGVRRAGPDAERAHLGSRAGPSRGGSPAGTVKLRGGGVAPARRVAAPRDGGPAPPRGGGGPGVAAGGRREASAGVHDGGGGRVVGAARGAAARGASAGRGAAGPWIRGSALPAALAAAAEAGLGFLPAELVARHSALGPTGGLLAWYPAFAVQATLWGRGGLGGALVAVGLFLAVGARMATLVFRDWRDPVDASIGWGAAALLGEVALAPAVGWGAELWPIVVVFFAGSLASRAASVRLAESAARTPSGSMGDRDPRAALVAADLPIDVRRRWTRVFAAVLVGAILLVGSGLFLGL